MAFKYNFTKQQLSPREKAFNNYRSARTNLLLVVVLTIVSIFSTAFTPNGTYFIFSAAIPRFIAFIGGLLCGKYPDFNLAEFGLSEPFPSGVLIIFVVIAIAITLLYLVFWLLSAKGKSLGLILSAVFFGIDTISMFFLFKWTQIIIDIVLHVYVLVYLIIGIKAISDLKKMPIEEPITPMQEQSEDVQSSDDSNGNTTI